MNPIPPTQGTDIPTIREIGREITVGATGLFPSRLIAFRHGCGFRASSRLKQVFEVVQVAHTHDFLTSHRLDEKTRGAELLIYDNLGIGLLRVDDPEKLNYLRKRLKNSTEYRILRADTSSNWTVKPDDSIGILTGEYDRSANGDLVIARKKKDREPPPLKAVQAKSQGFEDNRHQSWAIQACGLSNRWTGAGAKIAILDTGIDLNHPDWNARSIHHRSFIDSSAQDYHGHGTQCAGLAAGHPVDTEVPRFSAAPEADLYVAKVLENDGCGKDSVILAGIDWAIGQGCQILSLSVGVQSNTAEPDPVYELVGRRCLKSGVLFFAAAGNDSKRPTLVRPVSRPASCPSIFAVGAVDRQLRMATFTNGTIPFGKGQIDAVAPGVDVFTTSIGPSPYGRYSGTSMAAPLCAGVAALLIQDDPDCLGPRLWQKLAVVARRLPMPSIDVGLGLISMLQYRK